MAKVLCVYEIRPENPEINPATLEKDVRAKLNKKFEMLEKTEEKPLFFGIVALVAQFKIPETDGAQTELEDYLEGMEKVSSIELSFITRL